MKKFWKFLVVSIATVALCQCGSLRNGDTIDDINDAIEAGLVEDDSVIAGAEVDPTFGQPPTDVEVNPKLDAAVMVLNLNGEKRTLVIKLNEAAAPQTVLNFKRNVTRGYYDGMAFHRVIPNYVVQTGDPLTRDELSRASWGTGGPGYNVAGEPGQPHVKGAVAMARLGDSMNPSKESSGSQFYICLRKLSKLDGDYTVFGNVIHGMDVLTDMSRVRTDENDVPRSRIEVDSMKLASSKSRFVEQKSKKRKSSKPDSEKGGLEKFIERIW